MRGGGHDVHLGLGPAAKPLLLHSEPSGPSLSPGAHYEQRGDALWIVFPGREAKAAYMVDAAARDASDPAVVAWARQFMKLPPERRAAAILRFCQLAVRYQRDPAWHDRGGHRHGIEVLDSSAVVLFRGYGDCDAKTGLFLALCNVCGVPARLAPVFRGVDGFPHVRAEVLDERTGRWLIADPSIANSSLGHLPPHNRTHLLQRRISSRRWEVSDDDGTTWHPMEGSREAGDGDAMPGDEDSPDGAMPEGSVAVAPLADEDVPSGAMPANPMLTDPTPGPTPDGQTPGASMHDGPAPELPNRGTPDDTPRSAPPRRRAAPSEPKPVVRTSRRLRFRPGSTITTLLRGGKLAQRWRVGRDAHRAGASNACHRRDPDGCRRGQEGREAHPRSAKGAWWAEGGYPR